MSSEYMDHVVTMMTIPVSGIPKGYKVVAIRPARPGDIAVTHEGLEEISYSDCPGIILKKLYDPNVAVPNGWTVYRDGGDWCAAKTEYSADGLIRGLQHLDGFIPPPNGISATVER
jgi:hypothetical protein